METVSYQYNANSDEFSFALSADQVAQLQSILDRVTDPDITDLTQVGQGADLYSYLLGQIRFTNGDPLPGVDPNVLAWIEGAQGVNDGSSAAGIFIRAYTQTMYEERYGFSLTDDQLNLASNNIAISLAQSIISENGLLPSIEGLGAIDAGSIASQIFDIFPDSPTGDYAPWAGTLLFPFIGEPNFYTTWLLNMDTVNGTVPSSTDPSVLNSVDFKDIQGSYDLVAALEAFHETVGAHPIASFLASWGGTTVPSELPVATQSFILTSYGLTDTQLPNLADGTPFSATILGSNVPVYTVGHLAGSFSSEPLVVDDTSEDVVNAGPSDDFIEVESGSGLIDGGGGNNTVSYTEWFPPNPTGQDFILESPGVPDFQYRIEVDPVGGGSPEFLYDIQNIIGSSLGNTLDVPALAPTFWSNVQQNLTIDLGQQSGSTLNAVILDGSGSPDPAYFSIAAAPLSADVVVSTTTGASSLPSGEGVEVENPGQFVVTTGSGGGTLELAYKLTRTFSLPAEASEIVTPDADGGLTATTYTGPSGTGNVIESDIVTGSAVVATVYANGITATGTYAAFANPLSLEIVLSGVTLNAGLGANFGWLTTTATGGIAVSGSLYAPAGSVTGLEFVGLPDGSLSMSATDAGGGTQHVITFPSGEIVGDRITNLNPGGVVPGALEFNVLTADGSQLVSDVVAILNRGSVELGGGVALGGAEVIFSGTNGALRIDTPFAPVGGILNFQAGDVIDLTGLQDEVDSLNSSTSSRPYSLDINESAGFLNIKVLDIQTTETVEPGGGKIQNTTTYIYQSSSIEFVDYLGYAPNSISTISDGLGGVAVLTLDTNSLCFCSGVRIATPDSEVPVEQLAVGDNVRTMDGAVRTIVWIGVGKVLATRGRRNAATPVIIRKGALDENIPNRDLRVTKGHSLFIDGVLIPVEYLINHRSILWDDRAQEVTLYHVELATHDVLIANGALAESYRDDGNRWLFQNANSRWGLLPQQPCAAVLTGGPIVDAIWRRLLKRAGDGQRLPLTHEPDVHLLIDGQRVDAITHRPGRLVFRVVARPRIARLCSRAAVPQELGLARDPRLLGIAVRRMELVEVEHKWSISADDATLADGYHEFESDNGIRWTDGDAAIPGHLFSQMSRPAMLILHLGGATQYIDGGKAVRAA